MIHWSLNLKSTNNSMSVSLSQSGLVLQPCAVQCTVRRPDGTIVPATQIGTYQVDPETGKSELVLNSLKYTDDAGNAIFGAVRVNAQSPAPLPPTRQWFSSASGAPLYALGDGIFNLDGSPYTGDTTGYTASSDWTVNYTQTIISKVWARYGDTYVALSRTTTIDGTNTPNVVTYSFEGALVVPNAPTVDELPAPNYIKVGQSVFGDSASVAPRNLPICGFGLVWVKPLPTVEYPQKSRVIVGGHEPFLADECTLQSEAPMGTIEPPLVEVIGRAIADVWYRQRTSPLLADGDAGLALLMGEAAPTAIENFAAPAEPPVEPTTETTYEM
jgi:hypothetical protein